MAADDLDYGYDPTLDEPIPLSPPPSGPATLPASASVDLSYLPPVGHQQTPNCAAWATTYALATFRAAAAGGYSPTDPSQQASPAYIYIGVLEGYSVADGTCRGSQLMTYFNILKGGGTPSMAAAPYSPSCGQLWSSYGSQDLTADPAFAVGSVQAIDATNLDAIRRVICSGRPIAYGTRVYTDFGSYQGSPVPYVGNGIVKMNPRNQKPAGHCMAIIAYDDSMGALQVQNSLGTGWGQGGRGWIAYDTFLNLTQPKGIYIVQ